MATFNISDLKKDIRIALDQNMSSDKLTALGDVDTLSLEEIIESKILDATRIVETNAPTYLLDSGKSFGDNIEWFGQQAGVGGGMVLLPDDFLRLSTFKMSDWSRAVTTAISEDDPQYELQSSRYPGVRGCPQKPIVAIVRQPIGLVLEFYSCTEGDSARVQRARYIPEPAIVDDTIDICEKLKPAVVYYAAYLVASELGDSVAASLLQTSKDLMQ